MKIVSLVLVGEKMRTAYLLTGLLLIFSGQLYAQSIAETPADMQEIMSDDFRSRQFLTLTVGIDQDVKLPPLPKNVDFGGTFREFVKASISKVGKAKGFQYVLDSSTLLLADGTNITVDVKKDLGF